MATFPVWIPVSISFASTALALVAFLYQVRRARFNQSVDLLFKLEGDFFSSKEKKMHRAKAALDLQSGRYEEAEPIFDFFETMALLLHRGALDEQMVWHTFYYWITNYYEAAKPYIMTRQQDEPLVWKDFKSLAETVRRRQAKESGVPDPAPSHDQLELFFAVERLEDPAIS